LLTFNNIINREKLFIFDDFLSLFDFFRRNKLHVRVEHALFSHLGLCLVVVVVAVVTPTIDLPIDTQKNVVVL
jgi:hypothetical protein